MQTLDFLNDGDCKLSGVEIAGSEPGAITSHIHPLDFDGAEFRDDGGSLRSLVFVDDDGRDACHKATRARHTGEGTSGSLRVVLGI